MLEDEEEPHLNTDQVGCERNGSRVESPSANMPIVTGPKTPNTFFGTKILELGDGDHSPEWEARETEGTPRRIAGFTGDRQGRQGETEPPRRRCRASDRAFGQPPALPGRGATAEAVAGEVLILGLSGGLAAQLVRSQTWRT